MRGRLRTGTAANRGRPLISPLRGQLLPQGEKRARARLSCGYGRQRRKFAISASPSAWLFSGWNCVPAKLSRADDRRDRAAVVGARHEILVVRAARCGRNARNRRRGRPRRSECRRAADGRAPRRACSSPCAGSSAPDRRARSPPRRRRSSRAPRVVTFSSPRSAMSWQPTQMPRNGFPRAITCLVQRLDHAGHGVEPAPAIGEGADARQHDPLGAWRRPRDRR